MGVATLTIKTCDRCGERMHELSAQHPEAGELTVTWQGYSSGIAYDGAAGGMNHEGSKLLCMHCMRSFLDFMANVKGTAS